MDSYYIQQARKYKDQYEQLKDKNSEQAEKKKQLALRYLDLNRKQETREKINKRLRESNSSNPISSSDKDRNERLQKIFGIPSDADVADDAAELGINLDSPDDTNVSVDIPDNINDNETVSSTINPDLERLSDQDSSTSLPSYRSTFSLGENPPSSRSSFSSSSLPSRSSSSNSSNSSSLPSRSSSSNSSETTSSYSLPSSRSTATSSVTNSSSLPSSGSTSTSYVTNSSSLPSSRSTSVSSLANGPVVVNLGFTESLRKHSRKLVNNRVANPNICKNIFMNGLNVNSQYFYPSEFPNLTKIKSVPIITKGGKRTRKNKSKKRKNKKNVKIN